MKKISYGLFLLLFSTVLVACGADEGQGTDESSGESPESQTEGDSATETEDTSESTDSNGASDEQESTNQDESRSEDQIVDYELQIDLINDEEYDYSYDSRDDDYEIEIGNGEEQEVSGESAKGDLEELFQFVHVDRTTPLNEIMEATASHLEIEANNISQYDVEAEYEDGFQIGYEHEGGGSPGNATVNEFDLSLKFNDGNEWEYEYEADGEANIEKDNEEASDQAREEIETLLDNTDFSADRTFDEMVNGVLEQLEVNQDDIKEFDLEADYDNEEKIKLEYDMNE